MGDRNNPIKFGPEWLRNLAHERRADSQASNNQTSSVDTTNPGTTTPAGNTNTAIAIPTNQTQNTNTPKVHLAKLRYGREEMLALYDKNVEAPPELKHSDILYQARGKAPVALNTFDESMRESGMRSGPPGMPQGGERFGGGGTGRAANRVTNTTENRGRGGPRSPFSRQQSTARSVSWHGSGPKVPGGGYSGGGEDETVALRSWNNNSNSGNSQNRTGNEQTDWVPNKVFRNKRQNNTNWRQPTRDDGDEWRSMDSGRQRNNQDKWDRDWGDRPQQDRPQSWNSSRRWVGTEQQNDDPLPEWAMDGTEACGGSFDSSGAFHGFSSDDSNIPKTTESAYPLTRSQTHSFTRSRTVEEGSDEWWASEKAKKLSPKRFDASDFKFRKTTSTSAIPEVSALSGKPSTSNDETLQEIPEKLEKNPELESAENASSAATEESNYNNKKTVRFAESKTFDALMRNDINLEEASDERGNFQSVMINTNNSLRQKHQNIVSNDTSNRIRVLNTKDGVKSSLSKKSGSKDTNQSSAAAAPEKEHNKHPTEESLVEEMFDMALDDKDMMNMAAAASNTMNSHMGLATGMGNVITTMAQTNQNLQLRSPQSQSIISNKSSMSSSINPGMQQTHGMQSHGIQNVGIQNSALNASLGLPMNNTMALPLPGVPPNAMPNSGMSNQGMQGPGISSFQAGNVMPGMSGPVNMPGMPGPANLQGMSGSINLPSMSMPPPNVMPGMSVPSNMLPGMSGNPIQGMSVGGNPLPGMPGSSNGMPGTSNGMAGMSGAPNSLPGMSGSGNISNNSLFLSQNSNNTTLQPPNDNIPMPNHGGQPNMFPMHGLQSSGTQGAFSSSMYGNLIQQAPPKPPPQNLQPLAEQWYYEDPKKVIQGPFSSKEMYNWYRAGFFNPTLMVRRACDTHMRPLGSYGPVVPFAQIDLIPSFPLGAGGGFEPRPQGSHEVLLNPQGMGLDVMNINMNSNASAMDPMQFGPVGLMGTHSIGQQQMQVESLWSQPSPDMMWMHGRPMDPMRDERMRNMPSAMFFWDHQPSAITPNSLIPEEIAKEMKTEDQILAQLRATQSAPFMDQPATTSSSNTEESFPANSNDPPNLDDLQKMLQKDTLDAISSFDEPSAEVQESQVKTESEKANIPVTESPTIENNKVNQQQTSVNKSALEAKPAKNKNETEKTPKSKENNQTKNKGKKVKEEKKEEIAEVKIKEEEPVKSEKRSQESSPAKTKKEEKANKKEIEKEKKEWLKDGFTIVKGSEKNANKENKKKIEETKAAEDAEKKRKEEEKLLAEEEKRRKQAEALRKEQEHLLQLQRQASESVVKKAPWSVLTNQAMQAPSKDGLTLTEIQKLEREKKLEQMKEQQQMMQIIAQQQAAALAREQEMQAGLGWAKKKATNVCPGQSLAEIQAEARKQAAAAAAAAAAAQAFEEAQALPPPLLNHTPWSNTLNGAAGFWDTSPNQPSPKTTPLEKTIEPPKPAEIKKKPTLNIPAKKETSPAMEFDSWCTTVLTSWSSKIDVPTFIGFLKDIESPYEVKDYVKCYLGESKDTSDFSRQFLERRSKLLRVGMVTPSDDLCSPAIAVNPRTSSGSDYQEVKGKGKKSKKGKMLKVDARILGFSVTAAEDRINVGDIDSV